MALSSVQANLPSGYNRDLQVTKGLLMRSIERALEVLEVARRTVEAMEIDVKRCHVACDEDILATDRATLLALSGTPFRDAYRQVKAGGAGPSLSLEQALRSKCADGAPGNLRLPAPADFQKHRTFWSNLQKREALHASRLLDPRWRMGR